MGERKSVGVEAGGGGLLRIAALRRCRIEILQLEFAAGVDEERLAIVHVRLPNAALTELPAAS